jgi:hypothetical protein
MASVKPESATSHRQYDVVPHLVLEVRFDLGKQIHGVSQTGAICFRRLVRISPVMSSSVGLPFTGARDHNSVFRLADESSTVSFHLANHVDRKLRVRMSLAE